MSRRESGPPGGVRWIAIVLALVGVVLSIDGALHGDRRHRLLGMAAGAVCVLPWLSTLWWGPRTARFWRHAAVSGATLLVFGIGLEVVARVGDLQAFSVPAIERHPVLGHALVPERGAIDAWGFRNEAVPRRADVVCVGDSQTYGANVRPVDAWPRALERIGDVTAYSMALGGYGPIQYLALAERGLALEPRALVVGFYYGNDVRDAHRFAALEPWAELRDPELTYPLPDDVKLGNDSSPNLTMALIDGLSRRSRVVEALGHDIRLRAKTQRLLADMYWREGIRLSFDEGPVRTRFVVDHRHWALDVRLPRVRDGLRITKECLARIASRCRERGVEPVFLSIHTKEFYYHAWLAGAGRPEAASFADLVRDESRVSAIVRAAAEEAGMAVVDPLDEVVASLAAGVALWPQSGDGHLNATACELFAAAVWEHCAKL